MKVNDEVNPAHVSWADYCDALEHEVWLESRKKNFPAYKAGSRTELNLTGSDGHVPAAPSVLN